LSVQATGPLACLRRDPHNSPTLCAYQTAVTPGCSTLGKRRKRTRG
jgi:hypothetical protein